MTETVKLYRYLDFKGALKTLKLGRFRIGKISTFNDPFEWQPAFSGIKTPEQEKFKDNFPAKNHQMIEQSTGIFCLSDQLNDPILWSLYAEKHCGVAFEILLPWNKDRIHKMEYSDDRPVINLSVLDALAVSGQRGNYWDEVISRLKNRKSKSWAFEREYRLFMDINHSQEIIFSKGSNYWIIPRQYLLRVILGFKCKLSEKGVYRYLKNNGFRSTNVTRAKMCPDSYKIIC